MGLSGNVTFTVSDTLPDDDDIYNMTPPGDTRQKQI